MSNIIDKIQLSGITYDIGGQGGSGVSVVEVTQAEYDALPTSAKTDTSKMYVITDAEAGDLTQYWTSAQTQSAITEATSGKVDSSSIVSSVTSASTDSEIPTAKAVWDAIPTGGTSITIDPSLDSGSTNPVANSAITTAINAKASKNEAVGSYQFGASGNVDCINFKKVNTEQSLSSIYYPKINGKDILTSNYNWAKNNYDFQLLETSAITTSITSDSTDSQVPSAKAVYDAIEQGGGGGGKAIEAGRGISVTTGETADTVSFNLPISAGTGVDSITEGDRTTASGDYSHTEGGYSIANGNYSHAEGMATITYGMSSHAEGYVTEARNKYEHASGAYNVSSSATTEFGHSGNTLFSVGNGTSSSAKHNAFEIRQNGDIYITKDGQDVKLQDQLGGGGGGSSYTAGDGIDITNDVISVTGKVDTTTYNTYTAATDAALASKQTTLTAGTGISIIDNVISATGGGGGKAVTGGTNISVVTGETADTINCTLPISASTGAYSIMFGQPSSSGDASGSKTITGGQWSKAFSEGAVSIGQMNEARGQWAWAIGNSTKTNGKASFACGERTLAYSDYSFSEGTFTTANTEASHAAGSYTNTKNRSEFSIGEYNNSVSASTTFGDSGNTLFSVGNGTANNARHNAFEIRQNGDIYCSDGTNDVKLQDTITATAANTTALGGLKLVKLTQAEYDALATKDSNTLYVIVN